MSLGLSWGEKLQGSEGHSLVSQGFFPFGPHVASGLTQSKRLLLFWSADER